MARIRKASTESPADGIASDPEHADDLRRFIEYAKDMIDAQQAVRMDLESACNALEKAALGYDRTALAIAKRERDGISVRLDADIDGAIRRIQTALGGPIMRAEAIALQFRTISALSGLAGAIIGAASVGLLFMFVVG